MASKIRKRKGKRGVSYYFTIDVPSKDGKRKQKLVTCKTREEAVAKRREMEAAIAQGTYCDPGKLTFGEYLEDWLEKIKNNLSPTSYDWYTVVVKKHVIPELGHILLKDLNPMHLDDYYKKKLEQGRLGNGKPGGRLSGTTVLGHHRVINRALNRAVEKRLIRENPAKFADKPRRDTGEMAVITPEQARKLLDSLQGSYLWLPTFLALNTGLRRGEILGLRWSDVDLEKGVLHIRQSLKKLKNGKPVFGPPKTPESMNRIDITEPIVHELKKHKRAQNKTRLMLGEAWQDWDLVCCLQDGRPINLSTFSSVFGEKVRKLGLKGVHFHSTRHSVASFLIEQGEDPRTVQEILRHKQIQTTLGIYTHLLGGRKRRAMEGLTKTVLGEGVIKTSP